MSLAQQGKPQLSSWCSLCCPFSAVSMLGPLTTPEQQLSKTPSSSSLSQRVRSTFSKTTPK